MTDVPHRANNFDLIRLLAATQVAVVHLIEHFRIEADTLLAVLRLFPGVPIFFVVSGFLVAGSLQRSASLAGFFRNRVLRVFPGLWVCFAVSLALAALFVELPWQTSGFALWVAAQLTVVQFYNPDFLRGFGVGVLNGSLWTIPVEVQFYAALPVVYGVARCLQGGDWKFFGAIAVVAAMALGAHAVFLHEFYGTKTLAAKLLQVSLLPWLGLFMLGALARWSWPTAERLFRGRLLVWLAAYLAGTLLLGQAGLAITGNAINTLSATGLAGVVLAGAHTGPRLSDRLLQGNDWSYGLYLYHGPLMNVALALSPDLAPTLTAALVLVASFVAAMLSWRFVERPALGLKSRPQKSREQTTVA